ncbi:MAG: hypothetical protein QW607_12405 [Desulfurococcaceae archaeon]
MVSKELFLVLIVFFSFLFFNLIIEKSSACRLVSGLYYEDPYCVISAEYAKNFYRSDGGCVIGYYAGKHFELIPMGELGWVCSYYTVDTWYDSPKYNGQICVRMMGWDCGHRKVGIYDESDGICVVCDGRVQKEAFDCTRDYKGNEHRGNGKCESACGADEICDEVRPSSRHPIFARYFCSGLCEPIECNEQRACRETLFDLSLNQLLVCTYTRYGPPMSSKIIYGEWSWVSLSELGMFREDGNPREECFDGYDNDCNGLIDCRDPGCAGARNPANQWDICCQKDDDCPPKDGVKGKCRSPPPSGSGGTNEKGEYDYKCTWGKCRYNEDCIAGYCCTDDPSGPGTGEYKCVPAGEIVPGNDGKSYICVRVESTTRASVFTNLFNLIFNKKQEGTYTIWMEEEEFLRMKSQRTTTFFDRIKNIFDILNQFFFQRLIP